MRIDSVKQGRYRHFISTIFYDEEEERACLEE